MSTIVSNEHTQSNDELCYHSDNSIYKSILSIFYSSVCTLSSLYGSTNFFNLYFYTGFTPAPRALSMK